MPEQVPTFEPIQPSVEQTMPAAAVQAPEEVPSLVEEAPIPTPEPSVVQEIAEAKPEEPVTEALNSVIDSTEVLSFSGKHATEDDLTTEAQALAQLRQG